MFPALFRANVSPTWSSSAPCLLCCLIRGVGHNVARQVPPERRGRDVHVDPQPPHPAEGTSVNPRAAWFSPTETALCTGIKLSSVSPASRDRLEECVHWVGGKTNKKHWASGVKPDKNAINLQHGALETESPGPRAPPSPRGKSGACVLCQVVAVMEIKNVKHRWRLDRDGWPRPPQTVPRGPQVPATRDAARCPPAAWAAPVGA